MSAQSLKASRSCPWNKVALAQTPVNLDDEAPQVAKQKNTSPSQTQRRLLNHVILMHEDTPRSEDCPGSRLMVAISVIAAQSQLSDLLENVCKRKSSILHGLRWEAQPSRAFSISFGLKSLEYRVVAAAEIHSMIDGHGTAANCGSVTAPRELRSVSDSFAFFLCV